MRAKWNLLRTDSGSSNAAESSNANTCAQGSNQADLHDILHSSSIQLATVPEQPTRQQRLQQCSNDATVLEPIPAPQQGSAASAGEVAACPICGIKLPMQELTLHVEQELANLEEDNSTSAAPVKKDNTPKERHVVCGGVAPSKHHIPTGSSTLSHNYKASKPAAVQKSQKASLALTHAMTNVQLTYNIRCRFWCLVETTPRRSPIPINPESPDPLCLFLITILAVLELGYAPIIQDSQLYMHIEECSYRPLGSFTISALSWRQLPLSTAGVKHSCVMQDCDMLGLEAEANPATLWHGRGIISLGR